MSNRHVSIQKQRWARWSLLLLFVVMPIVNFSGQFWPGGEDRFTDDPQTRIEAAGYAFGIWLVIFAGMIAFCWQLIRNEPWTKPLGRAIGSLAVAGIASAVFVPISIYANSVVGWFDIAAHLVPLVIANLALRQHVRETGPLAGRWTYFAPSMYLGWISAAFLIITGMAASEMQIQLSDSLATIVTCCTLGAVSTIALLVLRECDPIYAGTIVWALAAIGVKQSAYFPIQATAWTAAVVVIAAMVVWKTRRNRFYAIEIKSPETADG